MTKETETNFLDHPMSFVMLEMPHGFTLTAVFTLVEVERSTHPQAP